MNIAHKQNVCNIFTPVVLLGFTVGKSVTFLPLIECLELFLLVIQNGYVRTCLNSICCMTLKNTYIWEKCKEGFLSVSLQKKKKKVTSSQFIFLSLFLVSASSSIFLITKCPRITGCYLLEFQSSSFHLLGPDYAINCLKLWGKLYNPVSIHVRKLKVLSAGLLASKLMFTVVDATLVDGLQVWLYHERAYNEQHFRALGCWGQATRLRHLSYWRKEEKKCW